MPRFLLYCSCAFLVLPAGRLRAQDGASDTISLSVMSAASAGLRNTIESTGRQGLAALTTQRDLMVALHAAWEIAKGDEERTNKFILLFRQRLNVDPPKWWQDCLKSVRVYETGHAFLQVDPSKLEASSRVAVGQYEVRANPDTAGFPYRIEVSDCINRRTLWKGEVWAAGRNGLAGEGVHQIELVISGDRIFVFGAESHGAYAEAFRLTDGKPLVRFCTCYWFNFSEEWTWLKAPAGHPAVLAKWAGLALTLFAATGVICWHGRVLRRARSNASLCANERRRKRWWLIAIEVWLFAVGVALWFGSFETEDSQWAFDRVKRGMTPSEVNAAVRREPLGGTSFDSEPDNESLVGQTSEKTYAFGDSALRVYFDSDRKVVEKQKLGAGRRTSDLGFFGTFGTWLDRVRATVGL